MNRLPPYFQIERFGVSPRDVVLCTLHCPPEQIRPDVILTPAWGADTFEATAQRISEVAPAVWEIDYRGKSFTLLRSGMGAPVAGEAVLALGCTCCERLVFAGSMGSLSKDLVIGDLCVVANSICGDGFSRFLNSTPLPDDCFLSSSKPDFTMTALLTKIGNRICSGTGIGMHTGTVFSMDCVLPEMFRLQSLVAKFGCIGVEMETAAVFKAAELVGIRPTALLQVSDSPMEGKTLYCGRTDKDNSRRRQIRTHELATTILDCLSESPADFGVSG